MWFVCFGLMMASFTFLFGRSEERHQPRITVDTSIPLGDWRKKR